MADKKLQVNIPFEILPEGQTWKVGKSYRVKAVLRQVSVAENDAKYELVDVTSLEAADADKRRFFGSADGYIRK